MAIGIAKCRYSSVACLHINELLGFCNLRLGIVKSIDLIEGSLLVLPLPHLRQCVMYMVPTMVGDTHDSISCALHPPLILPLAKTIAAGMVQNLPGFRGRNDERYCSRPIRHLIEPIPAPFQDVVKAWDFTPRGTATCV